jgi:hypothetical protein
MTGFQSAKTIMADESPKTARNRTSPGIAYFQTLGDSFSPLLLR